ncbi:MAG: hypothetical protein ACREJO_00190 [Phycisphaerales bacterium]
MACVRVIPKPSPRGLIPLFALVGIGAAPLCKWMIEQVLFSSATPGMLASTVLLITLMLIIAVTPLVVVTLLACFRFQHTGRLAICGVAYGLGIVGTLVIVSIIDSPDGGVENADGWLSLGISLSIAAAVCAGVAAVIPWLFRSLVLVAVHQTGQLCWGCGYDLGSVAVRRCPECGRQRVDTPPSRGIIGAVAGLLLKAARPLLILTFVCTLVLSVRTLATRTLPTMRFLDRFDTGSNMAYGHIDSWDPKPGRTYRYAVSRWIPLEGNTTGVFLQVVYDPSQGADETVLALLAVPTAPPGTVPTPALAPLLVCKLSREQAEEVIQNGVPPSLIAAIDNRVVAIQAAPASTSPSSIEHLDATRHFPGIGAK